MWTSALVWDFGNHVIGTCSDMHDFSNFFEITMFGGGEFAFTKQYLEWPSNLSFLHHAKFSSSVTHFIIIQLLLLLNPILSFIVLIWLWRLHAIYDVDKTTISIHMCSNFRRKENYKDKSSISASLCSPKLLFWSSMFHNLHISSFTWFNVAMGKGPSGRNRSIARK